MIEIPAFQMWLTCEHCGRVFARRKDHAQRGGHVFCCQECATAANMVHETLPPLVELTCSGCGKAFHRSEQVARYLRAREHQFCSRACERKSLGASGAWNGRARANTGRPWKVSPPKPLNHRFLIDGLIEETAAILRDLTEAHERIMGLEHLRRAS